MNAGRRILGPVSGGATSSFPVQETRALAVVAATQFAFSGADPYTYIIGNVIGVMQSGILRPVTVTDCQYNSTNSTTVVTVSGSLNSSALLQVWLQKDSDSYYMMNGCLTTATYFPGGLVAGAIPYDAAVSNLGFVPSCGTFHTAGSPVYTNDYPLFGGASLKVGSGQGVVYYAGSYGGTMPIIKRGVFFRSNIYLVGYPTSQVTYLYFRNNYGSYQQQIISINSTGNVVFSNYDAGGGGYSFNASSTWTFPVGQWVDFACERDNTTGAYVRFWLNGVPQAKLTGSACCEYMGAPWCLAPGGTSFDGQSGQATFTPGALGNPPIYFHDYLVLTSGIILTDGITLPQVKKPFSFPGLRAPI